MSSASDLVSGQLPSGLTVLATPENPLVSASAEPADASTGPVRALADLPLHVTARVVALAAPDEPHDPEILTRLGELGFLPGESVRVLARGLFGDPLAVRVGTGTFALRRGEARCVRVRVRALEREPS